jgi:hypothetical protein
LVKNRWLILAMLPRCPVKTRSLSPEGVDVKLKTNAGPIPVYIHGKLEAHVIGGKYVPLNPPPVVERIPYGQRRLRYRDPKREAKVACYFIGGETGPIKIGQSGNLAARLKTLQNHSPVPLSVLASTGGGMFAELAYHERFAAHRLHGEWFERHPDILAEIDRITQESNA